MSAAQLGKKQSAETLARLSVIRTGKRWSPETREKILRAKIGRKVSPRLKAWLGNFHRNRSEQTRRNIAEAKRGAKNPMWKGGVTPERNAIESLEWSRAIKRRDNYTCQMCGLQSKRGMEAHHIYSFTKYPERRRDLDNGITLCKPCHGTKRKHNEPKSLLDFV